jgi:hypothetical protein
MSWRGPLQKIDDRHAAARVAFEAPSPLQSYQVGGDHYQKKVQPWDAMAAWMTPVAFCGFLAGNVIKYLARYQNKNGVEDLKKARHYLDKLIEVEESHAGLPANEDIR